MRGQRDGRLSVITQVKEFSPDILHFACGQGFHGLEASNEALVKGESVDTCPGSKSMTGNRKVCIGTWESHAAPSASVQPAEEARRMYGGRAVGLTHSRGVAGVMSGASRCSLEGVSGKAQGLEEASAIHCNGYSDADKISPDIGTGSTRTRLPVYEPGSFAGRRVLEDMLL